MNAAIRSQNTTATAEEVRDIVAMLLATDVETINFEEPFYDAQVRILLDLPDELSTVDITSSLFIDVVDVAVAVGVGVALLFTEGFEKTLKLDDVAALHIDIVGPLLPILNDTTKPE